MGYGGSTSLISLLLLPPPPWPLSHDTLRDIYGDPLEAVLRQLQHEGKIANSGMKLDIALPVPYLHQNRELPRATLYANIQKLIADLYQVICVIAVRNRINVEDAEGIDARILLLAHPRYEGVHQSLTSIPVCDSVDSITNLKTLARSQRPWQHIFSTDNKDGNQILQDFLVYHDKKVDVHKVGSRSTITSHNINDRGQPDANSSQRDHHTSIAVGGTFDHIHFGHKHLLTMFAFLLPSSQVAAQGVRGLTVGITGDELLVNKKYRDLLESWEDRQRSVIAFLSAIMDFRTPDAANVDIQVIDEPGPNGHVVHVRLTPDLVVKCVEISDPFGPTITDKAISALVISAETRAGGRAVNEKRMEKGWAELEVFEVQVLDADGGLDEEAGGHSFQNKLSSTQIRHALRDKARARSKV